MASNHNFSLRPSSGFGINFGGAPVSVDVSISAECSSASGSFKVATIASQRQMVVVATSIGSGTSIGVPNILSQRQAVVVTTPIGSSASTGVPNILSQRQTVVVATPMGSNALATVPTVLSQRFVSTAALTMGASALATVIALSSQRQPNITSPFLGSSASSLAPSVTGQQSVVVVAEKLSAAAALRAPAIFISDDPIVNVPKMSSLALIPMPSVGTIRAPTISAVSMDGTSRAINPPSLGMDLSEFTHDALKQFTQDQLNQESLYFSLTIKPMKATASVDLPSVFVLKETSIECETPTAYSLTYMSAVSSEMVIPVADAMAASSGINAPFVDAVIGAIVPVPLITALALEHDPVVQTFRSTVVGATKMASVAGSEKPEVINQINRVIVMAVGTGSAVSKNPNISVSKEPIIRAIPMNALSNIKPPNITTGYGPKLILEKAVSFAGANSPSVFPQRQMSIGVPKMQGVSKFIDPPTLGMDLELFSHEALSHFTQEQLAQESLYFSLIIKPMKGAASASGPTIQSVKSPIIAPSPMLAEASLRPLTVTGFLETSVELGISYAQANAYPVLIFYETKATASMQARSHVTKEAVIIQRTTIRQRGFVCRVNLQQPRCSVKVYPAQTYIKPAR